MLAPPLSLLLALWAPPVGPAPSPSAPSPAATAPSAATAAHIARRVPHYQVQDLHTGAPVRLRAAAHGRPTWVHLWASWCLPCLDELSALNLTLAPLIPHGLTVLSIALDEDPAGPRRIDDEQDVPGRALHDPDNEARLSFGVDGVPASFLYDRHGALVWHTLRPIDPQDPALRAALKRLFPKAAPTPPSLQGVTP